MCWCGQRNPVTPDQRSPPAQPYLQPDPTRPSPRWLSPLFFQNIKKTQAQKERAEPPSSLQNRNLILPPTFKKKRQVPYPIPQQQEENPPQVIRGKPRVFLSSRERLKKPRSYQESTELPQLPKRKIFCLIFDKQRLRASSNLVRQKRASSQQSTQSPPTSRERRELAPLTPQLATRGCLSVLARERDPVGREHTLKKKGWSLPPTFKQKSLVLPPSSPVQQ